MEEGLDVTSTGAPATLSKSLKYSNRTVTRRKVCNRKLYWDKLLKMFSHSISENLILKNFLQSEIS